jgi:hypothetical protein
MISPEVISQVVLIVSAVWYSGRGIAKRITKVEEKIDALPCTNGGCPTKKPRLIVLKSEKSK